jgi:nucleoid-associated protein YgaU
MAASIARVVGKWSSNAQLRQTVAELGNSLPATEEYADLHEVARQLDIKNFALSAAGGRLVLSGAAQYQLQKDLLWRAIKEHDGWERDVVLDISVARSDIRGLHTVAAGETLASIARAYLGRASREVDIFEANRDRLNDPDQIFPGQQLVIPNR